MTENTKKVPAKNTDLYDPEDFLGRGVKSRNSAFTKKTNSEKHPALSRNDDTL